MQTLSTMPGDVGDFESLAKDADPNAYQQVPSDLAASLVQDAAAQPQNRDQVAPAYA